MGEVFCPQPEPFCSWARRVAPLIIGGEATPLDNLLDACPDEYEPMTFTVMPLKDFERAMAEVTDLRTKDDHNYPGQRYSGPLRAVHVRAL